MHLDIKNRIDKMPCEEIEGYLEFLQVEIKYISESLPKEEDQLRTDERDTLLAVKEMLYEDLFERLKEIKKANGENPPKYMGVELERDEEAFFISDE